MKKWKAPLVSLIIFSVLLAVILLVPEPEEGPANEPVREALLDIPVSHIARLTVKAGSQTLTFEPDDSGGESWVLTQPAPLPLDQLKARGLILGIAKLYAYRVVEEDPADLGGFGLDEPWGQVQLELRDGTSAVLLIGDPSPIVDDGQEPLHYAMLKGRPEVVLLGSFFMEMLRWDINYLRRKEVLDLHKSDRVVALSIEASGVETTMTRDDDPAFPDRWKLVSPFKAPLDESKVRTLITNLRFLEVKDFIEDWPEDLDKYGLGKTAVKIKLTVDNESGSREEKILLVGRQANQSEEHEVYVKVHHEPFVYAVKGEEVDLSSLEALGLINLRPFNGATFLNLLSVSWDKPGQEELRRLNRVADHGTSEWSLKGRLALEVKGFDRFQALLNALQSLEAVELAPLPGSNLAPYGLTQAELSLSVTTADRSVGLKPDEKLHEMSVTLMIGQPVSDRPGIRYAMIDGYTVLYVIAESDILKIQEAIEAVW